ncbi:GntR family transcriptional regulator [Acuticoccus sediminis]|nr:GntR family transcriptional regulator [Acuticoccus sediminis]
MSDVEAADRQSDGHAGGRPGGDVNRTTLALDLYRELERAIIAGEIQPGERLDEQEIAQRFNVSRTPVREALRLLGASDLVELRGRQGVIVRKIGVSALIEMFQVMAELEALCACLAARRSSAKQTEALHDIQAQLVASAARSPADIEDFYAINQEFHEAIYDASRNAYLANETRQLRNRVAPFRRRVTALPARLEKTVVEHQAIIDAIVARDAETARVAMRDHVSLLGDDLIDLIASFD